MCVAKIRNLMLWDANLRGDDCLHSVDFFLVTGKRTASPVMLSRDHHDVSGTDSPWRETSNIEDGSKFCADMAVQNVIGDACRGATSVSVRELLSTCRLESSFSVAISL